MIVLTHPFKDRCIDIEELFSASSGGCQEIDRFCYNIEKQCKTQTIQDEDEYKGHALEIFVEYLLKYYNNDNRLGVSNYEPILAGDTGVDGLGESPINQKIVTVQVKFRQWDYLLTANYDHLSNFVTASLLRYQVPQDPANMVIITTGAGLHHFTDNDMFRNKVRIINRSNLRALVDNVEAFWASFKESMISSRIKQVTPCKIELRQHQQDASDAIINSDENRGIIELPTGTGKTYVQADIVSKLEGFKVVVILSPRILLSFQHLKSVAKYLQSKGINAEYLNCNSGHFDDTEIVKGEVEAGFEAYQVKSTTSSSAIKEEYDRVKELNRIFVISSTYDSVDKIIHAGIEIDIALHDEAHHLVSNEFGKLVYVGNKNYFFTATPRDSSSTHAWGMNNEERFGKTLCIKTPKEMVEAGEMMPPALHVITAENHKIIMDNDYRTMIRCILNAFDKHESMIKEKSAEPSQIAPKLLVTLNGQKTLYGILKTKELLNYRVNNPDVNVLGISSDVGVYDNGMLENCCNSAKKSFYSKLTNYQSDEKVIIFYVDMLTEGIDVPGITGFLPLRSMSDDNLKQGVGRTCRLHSIDREKFYNGEITPSDFSKYIKQHAWVVIPEITLESGDYTSRYQRIVRLMYSDFGFDHTKVFVEDQNALTEDEQPDYLNNIRFKISNKTSDIQKFCHQIEENFDREFFVDDIRMIEFIIKHGEKKARHLYESLNLADPFNLYLERAKRYEILYNDSTG